LFRDGGVVGAVLWSKVVGKQERWMPLKGVVTWLQLGIEGEVGG